jgi:hypothetical protein
LTEIAEYGEDKTSKIEIFWYVVLTFFYSFIDISDSLVEIVPIEMEDRSVIIKGGNMVVGQLRKMSDSDGDAFDGLLEVLVFGNWIRLFLETILNNVESKI